MESSTSTEVRLHKETDGTNPKYVTMFPTAVVRTTFSNARPKHASTLHSLIHVTYPASQLPASPARGPSPAGDSCLYLKTAIFAEMAVRLASTLAK